MTHLLDRRQWIHATAGLAAAGTVQGSNTPAPAGCVVGQAESARVGEAVLAAGGNAVDAIVAAALTAGVVAVHSCGIGGYGGHLVLVQPDGRKVTAIDFNTVAPAGLRPDQFIDARGQVRPDHRFGWRSAGVPGTLAGLQLLLDRYGTWPLGKLLQPAIRYARDGFPVNKGFATALRAASGQLRQDPATAALLIDKGEPLPVDARYRNPDLADLLEKLADRGSVKSFYQGEIASQIATAFAKNGGLVTAADLAAYRAREVEPLRLDWRGFTTITAPLTSGGLTILQAFQVLKQLEWEKQQSKDPTTTHAYLETLRLVWQDRLRLLGDPEQVKVPVERLLSESYGHLLAQQVTSAVKHKKALPGTTDGRAADGTIHLCAVDKAGMMVALTLTHGEAFGARVMVPGLGLLLGHGMSRFDPQPGRPNSPAPGKRPLHNMCPTIVLKHGKPVLALGGTGGRRIPNAILATLAAYVGRDASMQEAVAAARWHTEGDQTLSADARVAEGNITYMRQLGYDVQRGSVATIQAADRAGKASR